MYRSRGERRSLGPSVSTLSFCVQHEETDLSFVLRILAEDGIVFRFEPPTRDEPADASERVVFFDRTASYPEAEVGKPLLYRPKTGAGDGLVRDEHHVFFFNEFKKRAPSAVLLSDFDFEQPNRRVIAASADNALPSTESFGLELVHEHHGPYPEMQVEPQAPGLVLDQLRRAAIRYEASSACARLAAGQRFELSEHDEPALSAGYAVTKVVHRGETERAGGGSYVNTFCCVSDAFLFRPARPKRSVRQTLETATVTGPANEEIHTDRYGRIRVLFHWDIAGKSDDTSSCWLRVAQSWSGAGFGAQFIPRVGMEVLVAYLGGDPDRPIVIGCLPDATHPPAFPLPANKTRSGWRSHSTPKTSLAGHNEISFEDAAGGERVIVDAHRNLDLSAKNDFNTTVANNHTVQVGGDTNLTIEGGQATTVRGHGSTSYGAGGTFAVQGIFEEQIAGSRHSIIGQHQQEAVAGSADREVGGTQTTTVAGPWTSQAESIYSLIVGGPDGGGQLDVQVRGNSGQVTDGHAVIEARETLSIICGESRLVLSPKQIVLESPTLLLQGKSVTVKGDGPALRLDERAEIVAKQLKLYGEASSVELNQTATVKGTKIQLGGTPQPPLPHDENGERAMEKLRVKLTDELYHPYVRKHYELRAMGFFYEGTTGDDGSVEHDVPRDAGVANLELWLEDYPTGKRQSFTFELAKLPPPETVPGLRTRLRSLGYFKGSDQGDELDAGVVAALTQFQREHELQVSGSADAATIAAITARYGH